MVIEDNMRQEMPGWELHFILVLWLSSIFSSNSTESQHISFLSLSYAHIFSFTHTNPTCEQISITHMHISYSFIYAKKHRFQISDQFKAV